MTQILILIFFGALIFENAKAQESCESKFIGSGIKPGAKDCESRCIVLPYDLGDFNCSTSCEEFCKEYLPLDVIERFVPQKGLLPLEKSLIAKYPKEALLIFKAKLSAESATDRLFGRNRRNDESDAFRHFVWAALSTGAVGRDKAKLFLDAHEERPGQPIDEKTMDLSNNKLGVEAAVRLKGDPKFQEKLEKEALGLLKEKRLSVLQPRNEVPEWVSY